MTDLCCCGRPIICKDGLWVHEDDGLRRCYPDKSHPVDRQLKARPLKERGRSV